MRDLEGVRLSMQGQLAQDYFVLRTLDSQSQILTTTVENYKKFLVLTKNRYTTGVAGQADVLTAQTQLETAQAQLIDTGVQRSQMEHAIAVLMGKAPSDLSIPATPLSLMPPAVPPGVPSELLERLARYSRRRKRGRCRKCPDRSGRSRLLSERYHQRNGRV